MNSNWTNNIKSDACTEVRISVPDKQDWRFRVLLSTDRHWDNPDSNRTLQRKHLDQALAENCPIIDNGDLFCAMQGKYDKRATKSKVRPEHANNNYLDSLVDTASKWFAPYAKNFVCIGEGNHETAIQNRHETNLIKRLVDNLNKEPGANIHNGRYGSWARFVFTNPHGKSNTMTLKRFHGSGGGGPVTKGVIQTNRRAAFLDADIIFTGHIHESWSLTTVREQLMRNGKVRLRNQLHISGATYKDEYKQALGGWHVERGAPPKPIGAQWLIFSLKHEDGAYQVVCHTETAQ